MKILVLGTGGREHALVWKLRQSPSVDTVWCAPGNGGISAEVECLPARLDDVESLVSLAQSLGADITVVGPEVPLVHGVADAFALCGLQLVGPSKRGAELEGSKIFAKEFMARHGIPTARTIGVFESPAPAIAALGADWPVVIKADGLCAGKGVLVAADRAAAVGFIERALDAREFGESGARVLIEEALGGPELSYIVLTDGQNFIPLAPTRDHKRAFDGDRGPNTGGMGAYSADDLIWPELESRIQSTIVRPALEGLAQESRRYRGFLYFGLMLTPQGPTVLEFNCRLGDPETQPIVMRMDFDLGAAFKALCEGDLGRFQAKWKPGASACVVMASGGYPGPFETGKVIEGLEGPEFIGGAKVFHAGTKREGRSYYTSSGRVLGVTASGRDLPTALATAYAAAERIQFDGAHYRRDIGRPAQVLVGSAGSNQVAVAADGHRS
ncbi:MAG: phosphoribosylamine--glycine ligase [Candidatus Acidiferrales bacterium]